MEQLDFIKQIENSEKQELAENEHKKFVDLMYPHFGLDNRPDYCEIIIKPMFGMGHLCKNPFRIEINNRYNLKENRNKIIHTVWHESSHYLHYLKNPYPIKEEFSDDEFQHDERIYLVEGIADLGALLMLEKEGGLDYNQVRRYHMKIPDKRLCEEEMLVWVIAMKDPGLLKKLVKENIPKARELMNQHREEASIYVNSICRKGLEIPDDSFC